MFFARRIAVWIAALVMATAAFAYSDAEEFSIRAAAQDVEGLEAAGPALSPGFLSASSRTLMPLLRVTEQEDVKAALAWLAARRLLPDAGVSRQLKEQHDACGPYRHISRTMFRRGVVAQATPFYLYRPDRDDYVLGGMLPSGMPVEALVRREDGVIAATAHDGRVVFFAEKAFRALLSVEAPVAPPAGEVVAGATGGGYSYHAIHVGQALVHLVRVDLKRISLGAAVTPYFNALEEGPERTLFVDAMARKANARVAINGTFFVSQSTNPQYGFPIGSFILDGRLAVNLSNANLLRYERCYTAFTNDRRLVIGASALPGLEIQQKNQAGQFDPQKFGPARITTLATGFGWLAKDGNATAWKTFAGKQFDASFYSVNSRRARSLIGVDAAGRNAFLVAEEEGAASPVPMSMPELTEWVVQQTQARDLVFLDGGGSTQLVVEGKNVTSAFDGSYRKNSSILYFK